MDICVRTANRRTRELVPDSVRGLILNTCIWFWSSPWGEEEVNQEMTFQSLRFPKEKDPL